MAQAAAAWVTWLMTLLAVVVLLCWALRLALMHHGGGQMPSLRLPRPSRVIQRAIYGGHVEPTASQAPALHVLEEDVHTYTAQQVLNTLAADVRAALEAAPKETP